MLSECRGLRWLQLVYLARWQFCMSIVYVISCVIRCIFGCNIPKWTFFKRVVIIREADMNISN